MSVISPSNTVLTAISVSSNPVGVAVSSTGDVYVTNASSDTVSVIGPTNTVLNIITVGHDPTGIAVA
ncbi:hypothetical protein [Mycobacterium sp.]|uniref:hypothetical protein n=1 Tax=Mycobacterium sp. TaxID=1785 RepID=UPI002D7FCD22|nr:hypothetical protein [Mycobacterium sp.]